MSRKVPRIRINKEPLIPVAVWKIVIILLEKNFNTTCFATIVMIPMEEIVIPIPREIKIAENTPTLKISIVIENNNIAVVPGQGIIPAAIEMGIMLFVSSRLTGLL